MVLCINLEGLHWLACFFSLLEKFVSGQCWCSMQDYHWLHNNCLSFANEFCRKLGSIQYKVPFTSIYCISKLLIYLDSSKLIHGWLGGVGGIPAWPQAWYCKSISFNSLLNHQSMQSIRKVFDPYIFELPSNE